MKNRIIRIVSTIMVAIMVFSATPALIAFAVEGNDETIEFNITGPRSTIAKGETVQLSVSGNNVVWKSNNTGVAVVDGNGLVKGISEGRVVIEASTTVDDTVYTDTYDICVTITHNAIYDYLAKHNILSYQYRYEDNYFYTSAPKAWQKNFGFSKLYDLAAPYYFMEYDYVRVHLEYEGKDWMIQLWKGQYGLMFYGCEVGVYNMEHREEDPTVFTTFKCADQEDWLTIQTKLEHDKYLDGNLSYEFETPLEKTWWSTGFKPGHLAVEEPCNELRQSGTIELKSPEMTERFVEAFQECGFTKVDGESDLDVDSFYVEGNTVHYIWQNIREAENSMKVKMTGGALIAANIAAVTVGVLSLLAMMMGLFIIGIVIL